MNSMPLVEHHPLQPFLPANAKVLMLGSFPPQKKRWCMDFYYPNFTNDMWRIFGEVFFKDPLHFVNVGEKTYKEDEIKSFLTRKGIALYDTACAVRRLNDNASDKFLEVVEVTDIHYLLSKMPNCKTLVTTGQKATDTLCHYFGITSPAISSFVDFSTETDSRPRALRFYRMPSSSRAYPLSLTKKALIYKQMFDNIF